MISVAYISSSFVCIVLSVQESLLGNETVRLVCHGLDTVANVSINGVLVGSSDNQFVGYVFDITGLLQVGFT